MKSFDRISVIEILPRFFVPFYFVKESYNYLEFLFFVFLFPKRVKGRLEKGKHPTINIFLIHQSHNYSLQYFLYTLNPTLLYF